MNRALWLRFAGLSLLFALLLSVAFLFASRQLIGRPSADIQRNLYLFYAHVAEEQPFQAALERAARYRWQDGPLAPALWVVDDAGHLLASSVATAPPDELRDLPKPRSVHAMQIQARGLFGDAGMGVVRLDTPQAAYLLVRHPGAPRHGVLGFLALFIATLLCATFFGLFMVALYLRGRSAQARHVIAQLQAGALSARFKVDRLDAAGGLMLDFNRMADEIQRLVERLETIERDRRELLQELGHDLRTPLTSVRTAADTLALHGEAMEAGERNEFHRMLGSEVDYLSRLLDDLFFIAAIDDPAYRQHKSSVDLGALVAAEARASRAGMPAIESAASGDASVAGDAHLLARLLRNLIDNATRYAGQQVVAGARRDGDTVLLWVEDDGPGMSAGQAALFGRRRSNRMAHGPREQGASLGLGSVIVSKIAALHGARIGIGASALGGARISVRFAAWPLKTSR